MGIPGIPDSKRVDQFERDFKTMNATLASIDHTLTKLLELEYAKLTPQRRAS